MEGLEPSSKQGSHTPSTCLFLPLVFVMQQDQDHQLHPYPLKFHWQHEAAVNYSRLYSTADQNASGRMAFWAMSRSPAPRLARELGHIYYASIRQRERNEFRQLIL